MTEHFLVTFYMFLFDFWRYNSHRLSSRCEMPHFMESREWIGHRSCREEGRFLSFSRSRDGGLLTISHSTGLVCVLDVMNGFQMLAETFTSHVCDIIKFLPHCRSLFCWHFPPGTVLHHLFCVKISVGNFSMATFPLMFLVTLFPIGLGNTSLLAKVVLHWEIVWLEGRMTAYAS